MRRKYSCFVSGVNILEYPQHTFASLLWDVWKLEQSKWSKQKL
jgi:hypothetical protein